MKPKTIDTINEDWEKTKQRYRHWWRMSYMTGL